jgi:predicted dehydrogenase
MDRRCFSLVAMGAAATAATWTYGQSETDKLKVAVIGHTGRGDYGHGLDTVWTRLPSTQVVAVADTHEGGLAKATEKLGLDAANGFLDYRKMLQAVRPEIVAVCPRHADQHRDMILSAINAGAKGVYVEKPFVRTPHESDEVLSACQQHNALVAVAHRNRYHPTLKVVADLVKEGRIGRLLEIRGRGKGDRRGGGEDLWVLGSHVLNMIHYLAGKPTNCSATLLQDGRRVTRDDVRDGAEGLGPLAGNELHARFLLAGGVAAFFDTIANDGTRNHGFGLQLIGSEGVIAMRADRDPLAHLIPGNPFQTAEKPRPWLPITSAGVDVAEPDPKLIGRVHHHDVAATDLVSAIKEGRQPLCNAAEGALTVEMICSVFESHRQGSQAVAIPLREREHPLLKL